MSRDHHHGVYRSIFFALVALPLFSASVSAADEVRLSALDLGKMRQALGTPQVDQSSQGKPLSIASRKFAHGVATYANSVFWVELAGGADRFQAWVGLDDSAPKTGSVTFLVVADDREVFNSGPMTHGTPAKRVDLDLKGVQKVLLEVEGAGRSDGMNYDHGAWAEAQFLVSGAAPKAVDGPSQEEVIRTPRPGPAPRINGPTVYGCRPGNPFLYRIPTQGQRPMQFAAEGLPQGLTLDASSGIITGSAPDRGEYKVTFTARNEHGEASRPFRIVSGDTLALTPPMGWNDWYAHYQGVTDKLMREAADTMIASGMADVGYQYVNIDDCWENAGEKAWTKPPADRVGPPRDAQGNILTNKHFPDMNALTNYIHSKGLKAGLYTSPGPQTCAGYVGSWQHEEQDARRFAEWGFDFLKYDWCSYTLVLPKEIQRNIPLEEQKKPYRLIGAILKRQPRDIVFNLCQYGRANVWEWGAEVGGHSWRTSRDLGVELTRFFEVALANAEHRQWNKPGQWNDPDYIQIGFEGRNDAQGNPVRFPLGANEQYSFMSLWSLMAAPLFHSGDMNRLTDFTLNVLCNPEVIEVNQDPLGRCADVRILGPKTFLMIKPMEDGSRAVGLFNRGWAPAKVAASWSDVGLNGPCRVRDLWRQKDLGTFDDRFEAEVPLRGVVMVRIWPKQP